MHPHSCMHPSCSSIPPNKASLLPRAGVCTSEAIDKPGDFELYRDIDAGCDDQIDFVMRPINRLNEDDLDNKLTDIQRHGVYLVDFPSSGKCVCLGRLVMKRGAHFHMHIHM